MTKEKNKSIAIMVIIFAVIGISTAQEDTLRVAELSDVVVTANKFAKSQSETGKVLTVIDEETIEASKGKDLSQLLNEQAGLFINGANSNPGKDKSVYLRGAKGEYTVVLLDGVPLNDPSSIGGGAYDLRMISVDQIERIEILKGNQSTLYGSNAIAGVINIITKKEGQNKFGGTASNVGGNLNTFKSAVDFVGKIDSWSYVIGASRTSSDGISEAKDLANSGTYDKDGYSQNSVSASLTYRNDAISVQPFVRFSKFKGNYDAGAFADDKVNRFESEFFDLGANTEYKIEGGGVHLFYTYNKSDRNYISSFGPYPLKGRFHHGELFLNKKIAAPLTLLTGVSWQSWRLLDEFASKPNPSTILASPYASLILNLNNGFGMEMGGRFNHHSDYGSNFTFGVNPSWLIQKKLKLFFNASSGFKAPSLQQLSGYGGNPDLIPEKSINVEGGVQILANEKFNTRVVAFDRNIDNLIFYALQPDSSFMYINQNRQHDKGIDVEANWQASKRIRIKSFYSYVTGKLKPKVGDAVVNLYRIPKHTFSINLNYQILNNWNACLNYRAIGKRTDITFTKDEVSLNGYKLLDLYSEVSISKIRMFIDVKNILNQNYYEVYGYSVLPTTVQGGVVVSF